ncbi:MAG: hypothetical protein H7257_12515 [Taibaiella sp.]|nr:hypothetical protein [Taibaiella sp.]
MTIEDIVNLVPIEAPKKIGSYKKKTKQRDPNSSLFITFDLKYVQIMKGKWYNNLFYLPNLEGKWFRHLNILAAIFIFIGGVGLNTYHTLHNTFHIVTLLIGIIIFVIFLIMIERSRTQSNSN